MSKRYLLFSFHPRLAFPVIAKDFDREDEMFEYIAGLRLCYIPYIALNIEGDEVKVLDKEEYDLGGTRMAEMLEDAWEKEENDGKSEKILQGMR